MGIWLLLRRLGLPNYSLSPANVSMYSIYSKFELSNILRIDSKGEMKYNPG